MANSFLMKTSQTTSPNTTENSNRVAVLEKEVARLSVLLSWYEEQFRLKKKQDYGQSSEKRPNGQLELSLFNEAEKTLSTSQDMTDEEPLLPSEEKKASRKSRLTFSADLPVETVTYCLPQEEQVCLECGNDTHVMKKEIHRELVVIPAQVKVVEHEREVYACRHCDREGIMTPIIKAFMPNSVIPKSMASPSAVAHILVQKYMFAMPLYRLEEAFKQSGAPLSRQTLSNWVIKASEMWILPMYKRMHRVLLNETALHADETTVQVLHEKGRSPTSKSYMWLYRTGKFSPPCILYEYQPTRAAEHPQLFLKGFKGTLHVDGYSSYQKIENVTLSGCWAHLRRKFDQALTSLPKKQGRRRTLTDEALNLIGEIYGIEKTISGFDPEKRLEVRKVKSWPLVEAFFTWAKTIKPQVLPKSKLGEALTYALNQKDKLETPFKNGYLEIDNNLAERSIKPFVIGRKNWMFSNTPKGATASSMAYSLVVTAKENNLNVQHYLTYLFETLPNMNLSSEEELDALLPWSTELPEQCYQKPDKE